MLNFLVDLPISDLNASGSDLMFGGLFAMIAAFFAVFMLVGIVIWVYSSLAFMAIAKKNKQDSPGLAWIPGVGPLIIAFKATDMPAWPWFLLIGLIIPFVGSIPLIIFAVYAFIWQWKLFEAIGKPGWWPLLSLIPFAGGLIYLVLIGIAAWSED